MNSDAYNYMIGNVYFHEIYGSVYVLEFLDWKEYQFVARVQKLGDNRIVLAFSPTRFNLEK